MTKHMLTKYQCKSARSALLTPAPFEPDLYCPILIAHRPISVIARRKCCAIGIRPIRRRRRHGRRQHQDHPRPRPRPRHYSCRRNRDRSSSSPCSRTTCLMMNPHPHPHPLPLPPHGSPATSGSASRWPAVPVPPSTASLPSCTSGDNLPG